MMKVISLALATVILLTCLPHITQAQDVSPTTLCMALVDNLNQVNEITGDGFPDDAAGTFNEYFELAQIKRDVATLSLNPMCLPAKLQLIVYIGTYQDMGMLLLSTEAIVIGRNEMTDLITEAVSIRDDAIQNLIEELDKLGYELTN